jgi:hypothetical protein
VSDDDARDLDGPVFLRAWRPARAWFVRRLRLRRDRLWLGHWTGRFANAFLGPLVSAQAAKRRVPDVPALGPFGELDFADVLRRAVPDQAAKARDIAHYGAGNARCFEHRGDLSPALLAEPRTDLAGEVKAVLIVQRQHQAAHGLSISVERQVAGDRELLTALALDFQPRGRAAAHVPRAPLLGDDALETALARESQDLCGVPVELLRQHEPGFSRVRGARRRARQHPFERAAALFERPVSQVLAVQPDQIEGSEQEPPWGALALLQQLKRWHPARVERAHLTIDHGILDAQLGDGLRDHPEALRPVLIAATEKPHVLACLDREDPVPVPLQLEGPRRSVRRHVGDERGLLHAQPFYPRH